MRPGKARLLRELLGNPFRWKFCRMGFVEGYGKRLLHGVGANVLSQLVNIGMQLIVVPVFLSQWGASVYGSWLMCFALPSLLALGDLGLSTSAGNEMIKAAASNDQRGAERIFQSAWLAITGTSATLIVVAILIVTAFPTWLIHIDGYSTGDVATMIVLIVGYAGATQHNSVLTWGLRADGRYALGSLLFVIMSLGEGLAVILTLLLGGGGVAVAIAYLSVRACGCVVVSRVLARTTPWLGQGFRRANFQDLRRLLRPSLAVMALPIAQAMTLQGSVLVIGALASPAMVSLFSTLRTATRLGNQAATLLNHPLMPEFAAATARRDQSKCSELMVINLLALAVTLIPIALALSIAGPWLIGVWTRGRIIPDYDLVFGMVLVMLLNGIWNPTANLLLSVNRQELYSYRYVVAALAHLLLSCALVKEWNVAGAVLSIVALELYMCVYVMRLVFSRKELGEFNLTAASGQLVKTVAGRLEFLRARG